MTRERRGTVMGAGLWSAWRVALGLTAHVTSPVTPLCRAASSVEEQRRDHMTVMKGAELIFVLSTGHVCHGTQWKPLETKGCSVHVIGTHGLSWDEPRQWKTLNSLLQPVKEDWAPALTRENTQLLQEVN